MKKDETNYPSYPEPFKIMDGCLYREVQSRNGSYDQKLCNFLPYIISEVTVDDGAEEVKRLRLGGFRQNGSCLPEIDVTGNELGSFWGDSESLAASMPWLFTRQRGSYMAPQA